MKPIDESIGSIQAGLKDCNRFLRNTLLICIGLGLPFLFWNFTQPFSPPFLLYLMTVFTWTIIFLVWIGCRYIKKHLVLFLRIGISLYALLICANLIGWIYMISFYKKFVFLMIGCLINFFLACFFTIYALFAAYSLFINKHHYGKFRNKTILLSKGINCFIILQFVFSILSFIVWLFRPNLIPIGLSSVYQFLYPLWWFSILCFTNLLVMITGIRTTVNWNAEWLEAFPQFVTDKERERYRKQQNINKKSNM